MPGDLLDNRGRGDARWSWPPIHPEGRKFGIIAVIVSLVFLLGLDWEIIGWPLLLLSLGVFAFFATRSAWCRRTTGSSSRRPMGLSR